MASDAAEVSEALTRAQGGDPEAYGAVVAAYQARLRAFIAGYIPRSDWVDDLAQQSFVSAYESLASFKVGTDFYAWLRSIAYNHLRAELEKTNRRKRLERDYLLEVASGELGRRLDEDDKDEDALSALRDCVGRLTGTARELVKKYYGDGLPLGQIGALLGRGADSLKVSLFKIRARLKQCMEGKVETT